MAYIGRYRTRGSFTDTPGWTACATNSSGQVSSNPPPMLVCANGQIESMFDNIGVNFYKERARGEVFCAPMRRERETRVSGSLTYLFPDLAHPPQDHHGFGVLFNAADLPGFDLDIQNDVDTAVVQCHAAIRPPAMTAVTVAEFDKTARMFMNAGKTASKFFNVLMSLKKLRLKSAADLASDIWLEYQYGWRPLIYDMQEHIRALNYVLNRPNRSTARGQVVQNSDKTKSYRSTYRPFGVEGGFTYDIRTIQKATVRAGILYEDSADVDGLASEMFGGTVLTFPSVVWELIPFSFVVDWFISVGDWLQAIRPKPGIKHLASWLVIHKESTSTLTITGNVGPAIVSGSQSIRQHDEKQRLALPSLPSFPVTSTGVSSLSRGLSAASLSFQSLKRILR